MMGKIIFWETGCVTNCSVSLSDTLRLSLWQLCASVIGRESFQFPFLFYYIIHVSTSIKSATPGVA